MHENVNVNPTEIRSSTPDAIAPAKNFRRDLILCALLAAGVLLVFWPVRSFEFLNYDDPEYVTDNPAVQHGLTQAGVAWAWQTSHASNWHPLTWVSHMLDFQFFGANPAGHHFTNLIFHLANALLLFLVIKRMTGAIWRSFFVAAIFAFHPLHVESVAWVSERKDVLSAFFWLVTMWFYVRFAEESKVQSSKSKVFYALALLAFALGLMSKPMGVTLPFVLLLLDFWPLNRVSSSNENNESLKLKTKSFPKLILEKIPFFALSVAGCVITYQFQNKEGAVSSLQNLSMGDRAANALVSYPRYVQKTFWPDQLAVLYPHPGQWPVWIVIVSSAVLLAITIFVIRFARRAPYLPIGWFWFLGTLVPAIGLVQVGIQSMADRYTYLPMIGLLLMVAWGTADWLRRRQSTNLLLPGAVLAIVGCIVVTTSQLQTWKNSVVLYERVLRVAAKNPIYQTALETRLPYADVRNNFGHALADARKFDEAIVQYEAGLRLNPQHIEIHDNFGNALAQTGKFDEAISHFMSALQINPRDATVHTDFGIALAMSGKMDQAVVQFKEAIRLNPNLASAHGFLGNAFAMQHQLDLAIPEFMAALRLKPYEAQIHINLGNALSEAHQLDQAIEHYGIALKLRPDDPNAHFNLGLALMTQGRRDEAITHYREALRLDPDYAAAQQQLNFLAPK